VLVIRERKVDNQPDVVRLDYIDDRLREGQGEEKGEVALGFVPMGGGTEKTDSNETGTQAIRSNCCI